MATPTNKGLYASVKQSAKKKFSVYPSAYANAWVVREYKKRGGSYSGKKGKGLNRAAKALEKKS
tara:strand:- start:4551 stop:4742 length:192 start_codon:yes stop_codon:yes gene_type:complete